MQNNHFIISVDIGKEIGPDPCLSRLKSSLIYFLEQSGLMNKYFLKSAFKAYADLILSSLPDRTLFERLAVVEEIQQLNSIMIIATEM